jgi:hypothetical protein
MKLFLRVSIVILLVSPMYAAKRSSEGGADAVGEKRLRVESPALQTQQLSENQDDLNARLFDAIEENAPEKVEEALKKGADVNSRMYNAKIGPTPLHSAVWYGFSDIVALLIGYGADVENQASLSFLPNKNGSQIFASPFYFALAGVQDEQLSEYRRIMCLLMASPIHYSEHLAQHAHLLGRIDLVHLLQSPFREFCHNPSADYLGKQGKQENLDELLLYSFWMHSQPLIDQLLVAGASQKGAYELARKRGYFYLDKKSDRNIPMLWALALREVRALV